MKIEGRKYMENKDTLMSKDETDEMVAFSKLEAKFKKRCTYLINSIIREIREVFKDGTSKVILNAPPENNKLVFIIEINGYLLPPQESNYDVFDNEASWLIDLANIKDALYDARKILKENKKPTLFERLVSLVTG